MPKKNPRRRTGENKRLPTPAARLKAAVLCIRDQARTRPANCLIGVTPIVTITTCMHTLRWIATSGASSGVAIADPKVIQAVVDALEHANDEARTLWDAAESMAEVANA